VKAFTGAAAQLRHDSQWQYPIATGSPLTVSSIAPQKQLPLNCLVLDGLSVEPVSFKTAMLQILSVEIRANAETDAVR